MLQDNSMVNCSIAPPMLSYPRDLANTSALTDVELSMNYNHSDTPSYLMGE